MEMIIEYPEMEVQFSDARSHAEKFGEVIELSENENNLNWVDVLMVIDGRHVVALCSYCESQDGPAIRLEY